MIAAFCREGQTLIALRPLRALHMLRFAESPARESARSDQLSTPFRLFQTTSGNCGEQKPYTEATFAAEVRELTNAANLARSSRDFGR